VKKYVMADSEYEKRENTYRKYKQAMLAADPSWTIEKEMAARAGRPLPPPTAEKVTDPDHLADVASAISVGDRCQVNLGGRRGTVRYVGRVEQLPPGYWVGIEYDEPVGKHDGLVRGHRYFECPVNHGAFIRPDKLEVGDFPEVDVLGSDDEL
jgi:tubulin-specific chaperone B